MINSSAKPSPLPYLYVAWFLVAACTQQHPVVIGPHRTSVSAAPAGLRIEAASKLWNGAPADFESYFTPFAVDVDNLSDDLLQVDAADFYLEDDSGRIASALRPAGIEADWVAGPPPSTTREEQGVASWQRDDLDRTLTGTGDKPSAVNLPDRLRGPASPMLGGAQKSLQGWGWTWEVNHAWSEDPKGVVLPAYFRTRALRTHEVKPGERAVGFLYFPRLVEGSKSVKIHWRRPGREPVTLKFKVKS